MTRLHHGVRLVAAALFGSGIAGAALAQPRIVGTGTDTTIVEPSPNATVFGGALTRVIGSGESAQIEVVEVSPNFQVGRIGRVIGSGESAQIVYDDVAPPVRLAQRGNGR